ncbi:MAG: cupin domain-containing protein [Balneolaceae bacterium]|nr:cupin domain-containing protein [Balneolaceae bacterium]
MTNYIRKKGTRESLEVTAGQGTTMQVLISSEEAPNFACRKFVMAPHGGMPKHTNLVEHEQYVLRGSATVEIGDDVYEVSEGDSVYIPSQVPHSYKAGNDGFEFICVVPNKEDKIEIVE